MFFNTNLKQKAENIINLALAKKNKIVTAESCTGGLLAGLFTEISGASSVFERGFVVYSDVAKQEMLGVGAKTLQEFGAVSSQIATEMALGALEESNAQISVAITGIAGPDGGSVEKPVGLVYIAVANDSGVRVRKFNFIQERHFVRKSSIIEALNMLEKELST
ncbi:MAG TPA: CinA family protein [Rickettsiales bacterium]|nr:CinA family protein [Rickettsiales bacterium]